MSMECSVQAAGFGGLPFRRCRALGAPRGRSAGRSSVPLSPPVASLPASGANLSPAVAERSVPPPSPARRALRKSAVVVRLALAGQRRSVRGGAAAGFLSAAAVLSFRPVGARLAASLLPSAPNLAVKGTPCRRRSSASRRLARRPLLLRWAPQNGVSLLSHHAYSTAAHDFGLFSASSGSTRSFSAPNSNGLLSRYSATGARTGQGFILPRAGAPGIHAAFRGRAGCCTRSHLWPHFGSPGALNE